MKPEPSVMNCSQYSGLLGLNRIASSKGKFGGDRYCCNGQQKHNEAYCHLPLDPAKERAGNEEAVFHVNTE